MRHSGIQLVLQQSHAVSACYIYSVGKLPRVSLLVAIVYSIYYHRTQLQSYITYGTTLYLVLQRKRCDGTTKSDVFCLGCGCKALKGGGRMLCSDASRNGLPMWEKIFDAKLQKLGKEADKQLV